MTHATHGRRGRFAAEDDGLAMAAVIVIGAALALVAIGIVARAMTQSNLTAADRRHEESFHTAEGGANVAIDELVEDVDLFKTTYEVPAFSPGPDEKAAVLAVAETATVPLAPGPDGEYLIIKPEGSDVVYSVGYSPAKADPRRTERVLKVEYAETLGSGSGYTADYAFLTGGDIKMNGNTDIDGAAGSLHANGNLDIDGDQELSQCMSGSDGISGASKVDDDPACPTPGSQPPVDIPEVDARDMWQYAEYTMCPNGVVRVGPAHGSWNGSQTDPPCSSAHAVLDNDGEYRGWKFNGCCDGKMWAKWDRDSDSNHNGSYYFYQGSVKISKKPNNWEVILVAEGRDSCNITKGGDIEIADEANLKPYVLPGGGGDDDDDDGGGPGPTNNLVVLAGRDLIISGNPTIEGVVGVNEQTKISGNPTINGAIVNEHECDTNNSTDEVHLTELSGNPVFNYDGGLSTPFEDPNAGGGGVTIVRIGEL